jgi:protein-disulfide isomerase
MNKNSENPYSLNSLLSFIQDNFVLVLAVTLFFIGGFVIGSLWTENQVLKGGGGFGSPTAIAPGDALPPQPTQDLTKLPAVANTDYSKGDPSKAKVTIVEYSDVNCSFCKRFHPTMQAIVDEYGSQVAWVYRHLPILGSNKQAEAAECAGKLGGSKAFWAYIDGYFDTLSGTPDAGSEASWISLAEKQGLNKARFTECLNSGEMAAKITDQMNGAQAMGINGTPGSVVVVGGEGVEMIPGALPLDDVKAMIDRYL